MRSGIIGLNHWDERHAYFRALTTYQINRNLCHHILLLSGEYTREHGEVSLAQAMGN